MRTLCSVSIARADLERSREHPRRGARAGGIFGFLRGAHRRPQGYGSVDTDGASPAAGDGRAPTRSPRRATGATVARARVDRPARGRARARRRDHPERGGRARRRRVRAAAVAARRGRATRSRGPANLVLEAYLLLFGAVIVVLEGGCGRAVCPARPRPRCPRAGGGAGAAATRGCWGGQGVGPRPLLPFVDRALAQWPLVPGRRSRARGSSRSASATAFCLVSPRCVGDRESSPFRLQAGRAAAARNRGEALSGRARRDPRRVVGARALRTRRPRRARARPAPGGRRRRGGAEAASSGGGGGGGRRVAGAARRGRARRAVRDARAATLRPHEAHAAALLLDRAQNGGTPRTTTSSRGGAARPITPSSPRTTSRSCPLSARTSKGRPGLERGAGRRTGSRARAARRACPGARARGPGPRPHRRRQFPRILLFGPASASSGAPPSRRAAAEDRDRGLGERHRSADCTSSFMDVVTARPPEALLIGTAWRARRSSSNRAARRRAWRAGSPRLLARSLCAAVAAALSASCSAERSLRGASCASRAAAPRRAERRAGGARLAARGAVRARGRLRGELGAALHVNPRAKRASRLGGRLDRRGRAHPAHAVLRREEGRRGLLVVVVPTPSTRSATPALTHQ